MEAFDKNPLINEEDLEIAITLKEYLEENPYIDHKELYETFATLGIIHSKNYSYENTAAVYFPNDNIIETFDMAYNSNLEYEDVLEHELIHSTGRLENQLLNEGMASLLQAEYSNQHTINDSYYDHVIMTKIFCELITPEKMLEAYTKKDMQIIKDEMLKLNPNEAYYNNLIDAMQKYSEEYQERYTNSLLNGSSVSEEDLPSYEFTELLSPYLRSEKVSDETKEQIRYYLGHLGYWIDVYSDFYFNKEESTLVQSNIQK